MPAKEKNIFCVKINLHCIVHVFTNIQYYKAIQQLIFVKSHNLQHVIRGHLKIGYAAKIVRKLMRGEQFKEILCDLMFFWN